MKIPQVKNPIRNWRAYLAEFIGTFSFVFITLGTVLANSIYGEIGMVGVALASGFAYVGIVFATVSISGGHLNPAITLALWLSGKINEVTAFFYILSQVLASFVAAYLLLYIFGSSGMELSLGAQVIGGGVTLQTGAIIEAVLTAILVFVYFATMIDKRGPLSFGPFAVGLVIVASYLFAGSLSGAVLNPAKIIGPTVLSKSWGNLVVWIVGPMTGSLFGVVYEFLFLRKAQNN